MDSFQRAEQDITAALFLNYHRPSHSRLIGQKELWEEFGIEVENKMRYAVLAALRKNGWIWSTSDGRAHLVEAGYKPARQAVLDRIRGTFIEVDWVLGEVATDGDLPDDFPLPEKWKWTQGMKGAAVPSPTVDSGDLFDSEMMRSHVLPLPDGVVRSRDQINWGMWGTIVSVISVIVAIVAIVLTD